MGSWNVTIVGVVSNGIDSVELEPHDDESQRAWYLASAVRIGE